MTSAPVRVRVEGRLGRITLDRPEALNALTAEMVTVIAATLDGWRADDSVATVLFDGAGERGFCAGGDVVALADSIAADDGGAERFWRDEYRLNAAIARYPKPIVALMDGLVLGGGVGLACHAALRVVTERSRVGLPETGIGFLPDVGSTWLLARAPGELGTFAALTGRFLSAGEALDLGLADVVVESDELDLLRVALRYGAPGDALGRFSGPVEPSGLLAKRAWIDAAFAGDDVVAILARLEASDLEEARAAAATIREKSPTASAVTLAALRAARAAARLEDALVTEFRGALRLAHAPDFAEGVRAQLVDKDRRPRWSPATPEEVVAADDLLAPLPVDLDFPSVPHHDRQS